MPDFFSFINEILWGSVMIYLLLGAGIWFSWQRVFSFVIFASLAEV
jgi:AGCS family alanine or glycine:cation symporter